VTVVAGGELARGRMEEGTCGGPAPGQVGRAKDGMRKKSLVAMIFPDFVDARAY
jgi:hypothetical protein